MDGSSPLALAVAETCVEHHVDLREIDDSDLYRLIVHVNLTLSAEPVTEAPCDAVRTLMERLDSGWFAPAPLASPQSRYGECMAVRAIGQTYVGGADKPAGAIWTSSFLPDGTSAWATVEQISGATPNRPLHTVALRVADRRILQLSSWADYVELVERYPCNDQPGIALVRWRAVALDYDAVHLTAKGLVATHGRTESLSDGRAIGLNGWDAECTAWLVDRLVPD